MKETMCMFESTDPFFQSIELTDAKINHNIHTLETLYEMNLISLKLNYSESDLKVMKESGTYDDLNFFYEQAEKEFKEKANSIIKNIFKSISSIFTSVSNTINLFFQKNKSENDEIEIDDSVQKKVSMIDKLSQMIKSLIGAIKNNKGKDVIKGIIGTGGITALADLFKNKSESKVIKVPRSIVNKWLKKIKNISDNASNEIENICDLNAGEEDKNLVKDAIHTIASGLRNLSTFIMSKLKGGSKYNKENTKNKQSDNHMTESEEIPDDRIQGSIFGYSLEAEYLLQESERFEEQMKQLSKNL